MNSYQNRWALTNFLPEEDLNYLHLEENRIYHQRGPWQTILWTGFDEVLKRNGLIPYWPPRMTEDQKATEMRDFMRQLYPIWKPMHVRFEKTINDPSCSEMAFLHNVDKAVWATGIRPNRMTESEGQELRKKAALSEKFSRVAQ